MVLSGHSWQAAVESSKSSPIGAGHGSFRLCCLIVVCTTLLAWNTQAASQELGRNLAANCASCHGTNGVSVGDMPSLAGQTHQTLAAALKEFRAGTRAGTIMPQLAKGYTDAQIDAVAAYLASQRARSAP